VRDRKAILVTTVQDDRDPRFGHKALVAASGTHSYVAAPILSGRRVVGILHGDYGVRRRYCDDLDRDLLSTFAEAFRLVLSRAALNDRLVATQRNLGLLSRSLDAASAAVHEMPQMRVDRQPGEGSDGLVIRAGHRTIATVALPDTLTARELDVLRLMAEGRTNLAIARELSISDNTVKQHVTHVLCKLGAMNRAEAVTRWFHSDHARSD
jgi:DNA-binding CsgD family transcriptional regulator